MRISSELVSPIVLVGCGQWNPTGGPAIYTSPLGLSAVLKEVYCVSGRRLCKLQGGCARVTGARQQQRTMKRVGMKLAAGFYATSTPVYSTESARLRCPLAWPEDTPVAVPDGAGRRCCGSHSAARLG